MNFRHITKWIQQPGDDLLDDPALMELIIPVMLACNDERGNTDGLLRLVELHDAMTLEHEGWLDGEGHPMTLSDTALALGRETFEVVKRRSWVGNMCWECVWLEARTLQRVLHMLQQTGDFQCTEGQQMLSDHWEQGILLTAADMLLIAEAAERFGQRRA